MTHDSPRLSRIFIGSSSRSLPVARHLGDRLRHYTDLATARVWDEAFGPGQLLLAQILLLVREYDFGVFVFAPDDILRRNRSAMPGDRPQAEPKSVFTVRDNVLFEAGVFMGGLGIERTFLVVPNGIDLHHPSDLGGLLHARYEQDGDDVDVEEAAEQIARQVAAHGRAPRSAYDEVLILRMTLDECEFRPERSDKDGDPLVAGELLRHAAQTRQRRWHTGVDPLEVMRPIKRKWPDGVDDAYWWFVVHGVFRFRDIDTFTGASWRWKDSIEHVTLSARGAALLEGLREEPRPLVTPQRRVGKAKRRR